LAHAATGDCEGDVRRRDRRAKSKQSAEDLFRGDKQPNWEQTGENFTFSAVRLSGFEEDLRLQAARRTQEKRAADFSTALYAQNRLFLFDPSLENRSG
jgi:hypothetical protein